MTARLPLVAGVVEGEAHEAAQVGQRDLQRSPCCLVLSRVQHAGGPTEEATRGVDRRAAAVPLVHRAQLCRDRLDLRDVGGPRALGDGRRRSGDAGQPPPQTVDGGADGERRDRAQEMPAKHGIVLLALRLPLGRVGCRAAVRKPHVAARDREGFRDPRQQLVAAYPAGTGDDLRHLALGLPDRGTDLRLAPAVPLQPPVHHGHVVAGQRGPHRRRLPPPRVPRRQWSRVHIHHGLPAPRSVTGTDRRAHRRDRYQRPIRGPDQPGGWAGGTSAGHAARHDDRLPRSPGHRRRRGRDEPARPPLRTRSRTGGPR